MGNEIDGDMIMAILTRDLKAKGKLKNNLVVGTVMSNLGLKKS
jgi:phosphoglucosamine mutase